MFIRLVNQLNTTSREISCSSGSMRYPAIEIEGEDEGNSEVEPGSPFARASVISHWKFELPPLSSIRIKTQTRVKFTSVWAQLGLELAGAALNRSRGSCPFL